MKYTICETFVGAGGSHIGFQNNGFESLYVNDISSDALETLCLNNPQILDSAIIDNSNILNVNPYELLTRIRINPYDLDVLFGGIVCKGFSLAGERSPNDERNYFYRKQLEFVAAFMPKISIIENVPGIKNAEVLSEIAQKKYGENVNTIWQALEDYKGKKSNLRKVNKITNAVEEEGRFLRKQKEDILKQIRDENGLISVFKDITNRYEVLGYKVFMKELNSACYGAATKRERIVIVAVRDDIKKDYIFPEAEYESPYLRRKYPYLYVDTHTYAPIVTVNDALKRIDYSDKTDADNVPMKHSPKTVERFKYIPEGDNIVNHMDELPQELRVSNFYSRGNTMRLDGNDASPTLVPGHSNFPVHPTQNRSITVREAACITGFPPKYKFVGSHTKRCEEVGNAVPPPLSNAIAREAKKLLDNYYENL